MSTIKTIRAPDGTEIKAQEVSFRQVSEAWNEYHLDDGTIVKLKTTALKILLVLDDNGKPKTNPQGDPEIVVNHRTDVVTS